MVPIEEIAVGDSVYAFDTDRERVELNQVDKTFASTRNEIMTLVFDGDEVRCTPPHRFYTGSWTPADALKAGDKLLNRTGEWHVLREIRQQRDPQTVFNLRVTPAHTYLVGRLGLLVHNDKILNTDDPGSNQEDGNPSDA
jgi:hypothetical protein